MNGQWLDNLNNCSEVKVLGEGAFGKVGKFNIKDNYPLGISILSPQNFKFVAFARKILREVSLLTVVVISSEHSVKIKHFRELLLYVWVGVV